VNDDQLAAMVAVACALASGAGTRALIPLLRRADILDRPNERSSHLAPTPRGGGIALVGTVLAAILALVAAGRLPPRLLLPAAAAAGLAIVSWIDDRRGLAPWPRLAAQAVAVALGSLALPRANPALLAAAGLLWLWAINLFNFMDGIDGLAGGEAAMVAAGLWLAALCGAGVDAGTALIAAGLSGAAAGFLVWNWSPARIFMGDVGSVPLGYLFGFLLLGLALRGSWRLALILPLYFLADATITLGLRLVRGEPVMQPHRRHFYQRAVQQGLGHAAVTMRVLAADLVLIGAGVAAERGWGAPALTLAAATVAALLVALALGR
jgi:UDP-N-acetylmuramyl pentapeptide phosphotransferase/UDP-N-acetylglucosamine-1-phosphate transferase